MLQAFYCFLWQVLSYLLPVCQIDTIFSSTKLLRAHSANVKTIPCPPAEQVLQLSTRPLFNLCTKCNIHVLHLNKTDKKLIFISSLKVWHQINHSDKSPINTPSSYLLYIHVIFVPSNIYILFRCLSDDSCSGYQYKNREQDLVNVSSFTMVMRRLSKVVVVLLHIKKVRTT